MFGRARMYNMGFAIFTVSSILLAITWFDGSEAAIWLIFWRIIQGVGGAFLMANSSAILTDAFPPNQRGLAMGINGVAAIAGSFLGLLVGVGAAILGRLGFAAVAAPRRAPSAAAVLRARAASRSAPSARIWSR